MSLHTLHLVVGIVALVEFAGTGQCMHWAHGGLRGMEAGPHMFFRSVHIHLLWPALLCRPLTPPT